MRSPACEKLSLTLLYEVILQVDNLPVEPSDDTS